MALHPLITQELSLARQDHLRREAEAVRSIQTDDDDRAARMTAACEDALASMPVAG